MQDNLLELENRTNQIDYVLSDRLRSDLELLLNAGYAPLKTFNNKNDYDSVLDNMTLSDGSVWPIPITLDITSDFLQKKSIKIGSTLALREKEGFLNAFLIVSEIWKIDKTKEAKSVFGTLDKSHPGVNYLLNKVGDYYITGKLIKVAMPKHYDYNSLRHSPNQLKSKFNKLGWDKIVAFQTRNPMHRAHKEIALKAASDCGAGLLIHPVVGPTKPGDVDHFTRVRCYKKIMKYFPKNSSFLSLLPLAMRMAGPREALWHALIRKNYGCTHIVIGRDHAGPGNDINGNPFYGPYEAQDLMLKYENQIGIKMVPFKMMVYAKNRTEYITLDNMNEQDETLNISGSQLREKLIKGEEIPEWFTYREIVDELRQAYPIKEKQGFTVFFTGLSGSGKSTIANGLVVRLKEYGKRKVTLLDGDIVRTHLSSELGFSKNHREINVKRIGFVASEITKNGGVAICAPIAPYAESRTFNRKLISTGGVYIEVFVSTPLSKCEERDTKGLYAKARSGQLKGFTGIDDPYEEPINPEINIDTVGMTPDESIQVIIDYLENNDFIKKGDNND